MTERIAKDLVQAPSKWLLLLEIRGLIEIILGSFFSVVITFFPVVPRGEGKIVIIHPGFLTNNLFTYVLKLFLERFGYIVYGWSQGINYGFDGEVDDRARKHLKWVYEKHGKKIVLIGWSSGGYYVRRLVRLFPNMVEQAITIGTPFKNPVEGINIRWLINIVAKITGKMTLEEIDQVELFDQMAEPIEGVSCTSIYSVDEGIVAPDCCFEEGPMSETVKVWGSHIGLTHNLLVFWIIADRLSQSDGEWKPFKWENAFFIEWYKSVMASIF